MVMSRGSDDGRSCRIWELAEGAREYDSCYKILYLLVHAHGRSNHKNQRFADRDLGEPHKKSSRNGVLINGDPASHLRSLDLDLTAKHQTHASTALTYHPTFISSSSFSQKSLLPQSPPVRRTMS